MSTHEVTEAEFELIRRIKDAIEFLGGKELNTSLSVVDMYLREAMSQFVLAKDEITDKAIYGAILRYLAGDETVEFVVKKKLYHLVRKDVDGDRVYMKLNAFGTPEWTADEEEAFVAPIKHIVKWQTPAWGIEEHGVAHDEHEWTGYHFVTPGHEIKEE